MSETRTLHIAVCDCGAPLVATFAFRYAEYYCLDCGRKLGMFDARREEATPELIARTKAAQEEWKENAGAALIVSGSRLSDCERCRDEDHPAHATDQEKRADQDARAWLTERLVA